MSDILDIIREKLSGHAPAVLDSVAPVLDDVRFEFGGEMVYVRRPKIREVDGNSKDIARRHDVTRRTVQRWRR